MPRWTLEARERQRQLIHKWQPWNHSTGPVTKEGKQQSARNSTITGWYSVELKRARSYLIHLDRERRSLLENHFQNFSEFD